jgi:hypothetical protein
LRKFQKVVIISLMAVLIAYGANLIDQMIGFVVVMGYLVYGGWTMHKTKSEATYLRQKYGI